MLTMSICSTYINLGIIIAKDNICTAVLNHKSPEPLPHVRQRMLGHHKAKSSVVAVNPHSVDVTFTWTASVLTRPLVFLLEALLIMLLFVSVSVMEVLVGDLILALKNHSTGVQRDDARKSVQVEASRIPLGCLGYRDGLEHVGLPEQRLRTLEVGTACNYKVEVWLPTGGNVKPFLVSLDNIKESHFKGM